MRICYLLSHSALMYSEVTLLQRLGHNVYLPLAEKQIEGSMSARRNIALDSHVMDVLDAYNPYQHRPSDRVINVLTEHFDLIIMCLIDMSFMKRIASLCNKPIFIRVFGREHPANYASFLANVKAHSNVNFLASYKQVIAHEPVATRNRFAFLPLPVNYHMSQYEGTWKGDVPSIMFVCSYIDHNPYYSDIYNAFKQDFGMFAHRVYGKQPAAGRLVAADACIVPNCSDAQYVAALQSHKVMFYHNREPRHIHYHPIEAVQIGMPVVFMSGGLFDAFTDGKSSGRCTDIDEARTKIARVMSDDRDFIERVIADNRRVLEHFSEEQYKTHLDWILATHCI